MEEMNWVDISKAIQSGFTTVVIGIGSTEQHGPHLPTHTDAIIGNLLAYKIAKKLGNALQAQTIRIGCSYHHLAFPGTISLKTETLKAILFDYVESLSKSGFKTIILIPSHGGNFVPTEEAINELRPKYPGLKIIGFTDQIRFMISLWRVAKKSSISVEEAGGHAGEIETSQMLAISENQVAKDRFEPGYVEPVRPETNKILFEKGMSALSKIGVLGDPTKANAERGEVYMESLADYIVKKIKKFIFD
jgi:creatinine amidohydrolase